MGMNKLSNIIRASVAIVAAWLFPNAGYAQGGEPRSFYELSYTSISGQTMSLADLRGKYVLCVNVASKCGYTPQYAELEQLAKKYSDKLVVIGFPCNQFLGQEPGSNEEIADFCSATYGVTFPLSEKIDVKGDNQHPIYAWLCNRAQNGVSDARISWNFNKFLIGPDGTWLGHFESKVSPLGEEILEHID
jgi:glutathione peroxidase